MGPPVPGDGPADFTATVLSNAAPGPASKIVVNAPSPPAEPKIVPASSLSRRPGAPGLDAELERNYPIDARRAGISGTARLRVRILADGRVGKVENVFESHPGFGEACAKTVRAARWEPPLDSDGRAVATEIVYVCKFEVRS
jgi:protein TonB